MKKPIFLFAAMIVAVTSLPALAADLTLSVDNIRNDKGRVLVALFNSKKGFEASDVNAAYASFDVPARTKGAKLTMHDLPKGRYAIALFHDENANGDMDFSLTMMPKEGFGHSNNVGAEEDLTTFKQAAFEVKDASVTQAIDIIYFK